jgi:phage baseplate assembly protein gpV
VIELDLRSLKLSERRDGVWYSQPTPYGDGGTSIPYEMLSPCGLFGRPRAESDGKGSTGIVLRHGQEGAVLATTDPRYLALLPEPGEGGVVLYAALGDDAASRKVSSVVLYGKSGDAPEGTVRVTCKAAGGDTVVEVDQATGDVTVSHFAGTKVLVKADAVYLGSESATFPVVVENGTLAPFFAQVAAAFQSLGVTTVSPPAGYTATKVKAL